MVFERIGNAKRTAALVDSFGGVIVKAGENFLDDQHARGRLS